MFRQHPGKILLHQFLAPRKLSQNKLARAIQVPPRRINEIVLEKRAITADTAVRLAIYFGNEACYWMQLQASFDIDRVKSNINSQLKIPPAPANTIDRPTAETKANTQSVKTRIMR